MPSAPSSDPAIAGRLLIQVPIIEGSGVNAAIVKGALEQLCGVKYVQANSTTDSVLVLFEPQTLTRQEIVARLVELNAFERRRGRRSARPRELCVRIAGALLRRASRIVPGQITPALAGL